MFRMRLKVRSPLYYSSDIDVIVRLFSFKLLPESERLRVVTAISELAIETPDSGFLKAEIKSLMTPNELSSLLGEIQTELIPNLDEKIYQWKDNYNHEDEPELYFDKLKDALEEYKSEFENNEVIAETIDNALKKIDLIVEELKSELPEDEYDKEEEFLNRNRQEDAKNIQRSIFDDVDL